MGIYIKKMEMPESCYYCPFADGVWQKDKRCLINGKEMPRDGRDVQQNHINCPLVPVPKHGRCVDESALLKGCGYIIAYGMACIPVKHIANAPTILEAEEGET